MRVLVLVLLAVVAIWLIRRTWRRMESSREAPPPAGTGELVACTHCGVLLPRAEARGTGEQLYCSDEHARLGPRGPAEGR